MGEFEKSLGQQGSNPPAAPQTVKALAAEYLCFKDFVLKAITLLKDQLDLLSQGFDRQETQSRRKALLVHGLPEAKDEDVLSKIVALMHDQMKMNDINDSTLEVVHRLGTKKDKNRPVLVRFASVKARTAVWNAKTKLKGTKLSLKEFLTKPRQEVFAAARAHFGIKKCWSADGTIVVLLPDGSRKKLITMTELKALQSQHPAAAIAKG